MNSTASSQATPAGNGHRAAPHKARKNVTAQPFQEGKGWSVRLSVHGKRLYLSGFASAQAAADAAGRQRTHVQDEGHARGKGPHQTTLAQALADYALSSLPKRKGAEQDARRINKYLRAAGQPTLRCEALRLPPDARSPRKAAQSAATKPQAVHWAVSFEAPHAQRRIAPGLGEHRQLQAKRTRRSDAVRDRLACKSVAHITTDDIQTYMDALGGDGLSAATIALERSLLRAFFNHARKIWKWAQPARNPAVDLKLPAVDNARDRVLTPHEQARLSAALRECDNPLIAPVLALLIATAMRSSEVLRGATWRDVDWDQKLLHLRDGKTGARDVPLSPAAIVALRSLPQGPAHAPLVHVSYEALKAAWSRACTRAGVEDAHLHDLRHTAATEFAVQHGHGNVFLLQAFTGHKTLSQLQRYVNVKPSNVVDVLHADTRARGVALLAPQSPLLAGREHASATVPGLQWAPAAALGGVPRARTAS